MTNSTIVVPVLHKGDIFRKDGPIGAYKIERIMLPGYPEYDGGVPGVSVRLSTRRGWRRDGLFLPCCDVTDFYDHCDNSGRRLWNANLAKTG